MGFWKGKEFEALSLRYNDHVELLRKLTDIDLKLFLSSLTVQLILGAWLFENQGDDLIMKIGMLIIDIGLMFISLRLLYLNYIRRFEAVLTLKNVINALGFTRVGAYIQEKSINPTPQQFLPKYLQTEKILSQGFRPFWPYYKWGIIVSIIGLSFVIFSKELAELW